MGLLFVPNHREGHWEAAEAVFDERVVSYTNLGKEPVEVRFREEGHIVTGCPWFADFRDKSVKIFLGQKEM